MRKSPFFFAILMLSVLAGAPTVRAEGPMTPKLAKPDDRGQFKAQIESELILRKVRLNAIEQELQKQSKRYDELAAQKMELAKISSEKASQIKEAAEQKAVKAQYAKAQAGPKPVAKGKDAKGKDAKAGDAKDAKAGGAGGKDAGGKDAGGGAKGGDPSAAKPIDPMLTQNYLVMRLRDEARQLRERIAFLETVLLRL